MRPQILNMDSEVLEEFRNKFNSAIAAVIRNLIDKKLTAGTVTGKIDITIMEQVDKETGEVYWSPEIEPVVNMKVGAKGKLECGKKAGMILKITPCRAPVVASNQISFDEMIELERKGSA